MRKGGREGGREGGWEGGSEGRGRNVFTKKNTKWND